MPAVVKRLGPTDVATIAVAVNGPIPGTAASFRQTGRARYRLAPAGLDEDERYNQWVRTRLKEVWPPHVAN